VKPYLAADGSTLRVFIVDDEPDNRELFQIMLDWEGFLTSTFASGEDALAAVDEQAPHLMLIDLMMPGMNGYEVVSHMRANPRTKSIPIMIVSAMNDRASKVAALAAGADDFLSKPMNRVELCDRVKQLLELKAAERLEAASVDMARLVGG